jgi:hypothetical protein
MYVDNRYMMTNIMTNHIRIRAGGPRETSGWCEFATKGPEEVPPQNSPVPVDARSPTYCLSVLDHYYQVLVPRMVMIVE